MRCSILILISMSLLRGPSARAEQRVRIAELSPAAERAINRGLGYLLRSQNADGSWGKDEYDVALTSLALMAFMVKGYFPGKPPYGRALDKAVDYLLKRAELGGGYIGKSMYEHGLATLAFSEVWGMSDREEIRDTLKAAVNIIIRSQNNAGGWRYDPKPVDADVSVTVMQIVALASAGEAGIYVPRRTIDRALRYVHKCYNPYEGGFGYQPGGSPGFARTAAGVMSLMMCGERNSKAVKSALRYIINYKPKEGQKTKFFYYGHYYAMQAMYQAGDSYYQKWYPKVRDILLARQQHDGSWKSGHGNPYATAMSILVLGVPYRFLPIYQR